MTQKNVVERAFELARELRCQQLKDIHRRLVAEGYSNVEAHLDGKMIRKQLREELRRQSHSLTFSADERLKGA